MTPIATSDIAFYFGAQHRFERSTFGASLASAATRGTSSSGRRIPAPSASWAWRPSWSSPHVPPTALHVAHGEGAGYEVDDETLIRFARVSRRMLAVERRSALHKRALEAFFGDRGSMWAAATADRRGERGEVVWRGAGPGSIAALYILTPRGQAFVAGERARAAKRAAGAAMPHLTDDEVLASAFAVQAVQPDPLRVARLNRVRDEAERLLGEALRLWREVGGAGGAGTVRAVEAMVMASTETAEREVA